MEKDWIKIYQTNSNFEAELLKQVLNEEDIPCVVVSKKDSSFLYGAIEIYVPKKLEATAMQIIQNQK